ncbi:MAG: single-stranded-DNA-specific exonuclease RecJ [Lachnospiraceae bacterium]|nr:single-stranded-DNA-specific exonuclease RecJ [Lachnospiraceae bacterium]
MEKWMVRTKRADFNALAERFGIDPVIARIMVNRGVEPEDMEGYLHPTKEQLHNEGTMKDLREAADIIATAIDAGKRIRVVGDYDIDGICSTYILTEGIKRCGGAVDYAIPHRIEDGYGVNPQMMAQAAEDGIALVVTCDNGISAFPAMEEAKRLGIDVVITDHHQLHYEEEDGKRTYIMPPALAVVNPHREDCPYPYKEICGAVVAWKVIMGLYERCGIAKKEAEIFWEEAAFATVGDIMPLLDENRTIVKLGLEKMAHTKNIGLHALMERSGIDRTKLSAYHLGFVLGPCFNATGRLDTATLAMELLQETDPQQAIRRADELIHLNEERKTMTERGVEMALAVIEEEHLEEDSVLVVYVPGLHESLNGIVAGRLKERFYRPTFVLSDGAECVKGSGRSIEGYIMNEKMEECSKYLKYYGGHPMAAGLSMERENVADFRREMNARANLTEEVLTPKIHIDVPMPLSYISKNLVNQLDALEPFGNANEKPCFADKNLKVERVFSIGKEKQYRKLRLVTESGCPMEGLYFGDGKELDEFLSTHDRIMITYYPSINVFRDVESLQVMITHYQ